MSVFYLPVYGFRHERTVLFPQRYAVNGTERCCPVIRSKHSLKTSRRKLISDPKLFGLSLGYGDVALVVAIQQMIPDCLDLWPVVVRDVSLVTLAVPEPPGILVSKPNQRMVDHHHGFLILRVKQIREVRVTSDAAILTASHPARHTLLEETELLLEMSPASALDRCRVFFAATQILNQFILS